MQCRRVLSDVSTSDQQSSTRARRRHFHAYVFARAHSRQRHGHVPNPWRGDQHQIDIVARHHLLIGMVARVVERRRRLSGFHNLGLGGFGLLLDDVAQRRNPNLRDGPEIVDQAVAAAADADEAQPHGVLGFEFHPRDAAVGAL